MHSRSKLSSGFTLVELLVVVAILGILGTIAVSSVISHVRATREVAAKMATDELKRAVDVYLVRHKQTTPPSELGVVVEPDGDNEPIVAGGESALLDPWDMPYRIVVTGRRFYVASNGPDGLPDTEDDIRSDARGVDARGADKKKNKVDVYSNVDDLGGNSQGKRQ